jgi:hypothetical protein
VTIHLPGGRAQDRDVVYCYFRRRDGDIQVVRVYEHARVRRPATWVGPFATALDAARDADHRLRGTNG